METVGLFCFVVIAFVCLAVFHLVIFSCLVHVVAVRVLMLVYPIIMISGVDDQEYLALHSIVWALWFVVDFGIVVLWFGRIHVKVDALELIGYESRSVNLTVQGNTLKTLKHRINRVYGNMQLVKYIKKTLIEKFGEDVALIIQMYAFPEWSQSEEK